MHLKCSDVVQRDYFGLMLVHDAGIDDAQLAIRATLNNYGKLIPYKCPRLSRVKVVIDEQELRILTLETSEILQTESFLDTGGGGILPQKRNPNRVMGHPGSDHKLDHCSGGFDEEGVVLKPNPATQIFRQYHRKLRETVNLERGKNIIEASDGECDHSHFLRYWSVLDIGDGCTSRDGLRLSLAADGEDQHGQAEQQDSGAWGGFHS